MTQLTITRAVRLSPELSAHLNRVARKTGQKPSQIMRAALELYLPHLELQVQLAREVPLISTEV
uniref:Uncharacterized protein n=1 Tax=viral metagenome TaxID=1070528 RepID=A0A6H1ZRW8_9ZZZZ